MDDKNKAGNRISCDRQTVWLFVIIILCFVLSGCTYVYYKHFVIRGEDMDHNTIIEFKDLSIVYDIEADYRSTTERILTDSFNISMAYSTPDSNTENNRRIHDSFNLDFLRLKLVGEVISHAFKDVVAEEIIHQTTQDRRRLQLGKVFIPANVDSLVLSVSFSYSNDKGETQLIDTTGIYFRRADGRYSVPLGFLLD
jgi:hypothetical protein